MHDPYIAKAMEYLLGITFLVLFTGFWRYATGGANVAEPAVVRATLRLPRLPLLDMFRVPEGVMFHPGHAWVRADAPGMATIGMDDFAQQLVGPIKALNLPAIGTSVEQGTRGWRLKADSKSVDMLSPLTGRVVAINQEALENPTSVNEDPFGRGWLMQIEAPRLVANEKQLLRGRAARDLMSASWDELSSMLSPEVGLVMHDGGAPVNGFARGVDEQNWDVVARRFLLT
jgi:glycine cleavage system H lipoate-binding protein